MISRMIKWKCSYARIGNEDYLEIVDSPSSGFGTAFRGEDDLELALFFNDEVCAAVLISESMTANDDGLFPAWDEPGDSGDDNWFTEDGAVEDVSDRSVW